MEDKRKRGLGRGLSALLGNTPLAQPAASSSSNEPVVIDLKGTVQIPVTHMQSGRYQPRTEFDQDALQDLADSIRAKGIIQPILVRPLPEDPSRYEIIAGERRWRAAQMAQQHDVPVLVRDFTDQEAAEVALIENLQRRDLSPLEEAEGYRRLIDDFSRTQDDLAQALGKSRSHVANMIRLLALPEQVKHYMRDGRLTAGHARALLNAEDPVVLAQQVVSKGLNVRQTEKLATDKGGVKARKPKFEREKDADTLALERDLARVLGLKVEVEFLGRGGQVVIHYDTLDQLDDILYRLNNPSERHRSGTPMPDARGFDDFEADNAAFAASFGRTAPTAEEGDEESLEESVDAWQAELAAESEREAAERLAPLDGELSDEDDLDVAALLDQDSVEMIDDSAPQTDDAEQAEAPVVDAQSVLSALRAAVDGDNPLAALARMGAFSGDQAADNGARDDQPAVEEQPVEQASADVWADSLKGTSLGDTKASDDELHALLSQIRAGK